MLKKEETKSIEEYSKEKKQTKYVDRLHRINDFTTIQNEFSDDISLKVLLENGKRLFVFVVVLC